VTEAIHLYRLQLRKQSRKTRHERHRPSKDEKIKMDGGTEEILFAEQILKDSRKESRNPTLKGY